MRGLWPRYLRRSAGDGTVGDRGASHAMRRRKGGEDVRVTTSYKGDDRFLIGHGNAFDSTVKWPACKAGFYGPCRIMSANHRFTR